MLEEKGSDTLQPYKNTEKPDKITFSALVNKKEIE